MKIGANATLERCAKPVLGIRCFVAVKVVEMAPRDPSRDLLGRHPMLVKINTGEALSVLRSSIR